MSHAGQDSPQQREAGEEESLTTILNEEQRGELTLLIASAMAAMRKTISSSFEINAGITQDAIKAFSTEDEKIMDQSVDPAKADVPKIEAEKKLKEQRQKELDAPQTKELKAASLNFFDDWRGKVIERVGEVINSREQAVKDAKRAHTPSHTAPKASDSKHEATEEAANVSAQATLEKLYPPISTPLAKLEEKSRLLVLHSTLLLMLSLEHYVAPSRILLLYLTSSLKLPLHSFVEDEEKVAKGLLEAAKQMSGDAEAQKKVDENQSSRKWKVGLASVAGAALIGVTGGLAAPLVAAGVGSVMGGLGLGATAAAGYLGTVAGSTVIVGGLFGAYGGRMTGQMMDKYAREVEDFAFVPVHKRKEGDSRPPGQDHKKTKSTDEKAGQADPASRRLRVTIGVTGWLTDASQVEVPWRVISPSTSEPFALRFELEALLQLGNSLDAMVSSAAWGYAKHEIISRTVFAGLAQAAAWPMAILSLGRVVDNPFSIARSRAEKAGKVLADALINKAQGERPVTLIGYSLGARVIYSCLSSLAERKAFGLVESAVLIGAPCPSATADWRTLRTVVSGRLVNVYSENDYVLRFLYRTSSMQYGVAGLSKVTGLPSVENVDVSETVNGHLRYRYLVGSILSKIGFEDLNMDEVKKEEAAFQKLLKEEEKQSYKDTAKEKGQKVLEDAPLQLGKKNEGKEGEDNAATSKPKDAEKGVTSEEDEEAEREAERMEAEVRAKTEKSMLDSVSLSGYLPARLRKATLDDPEVEGGKEGEKQGGKQDGKQGGQPQATGQLPQKDEKKKEDKKEDRGFLGSLASGGGFFGGK